jgi:hypothetical protein
MYKYEQMVLQLMLRYVFYPQIRTSIIFSFTFLFLISFYLFVGCRIHRKKSLEMFIFIIMDIMRDIHICCVNVKKH